MSTREETLDRQATHVRNVVLSLLGNDVRRATKYVSPTMVIRASRRLDFKKKDRMPDKRENISIVITIGKPNYLERDFIKDCKKAGEKFPVQGIILTFPPKARNRKGGKKRK